MEIKLVQQDYLNHTTDYKTYKSELLFPQLCSNFSIYGNYGLFIKL